MDFGLTSEQIAMQDTLRRFLSKTHPPLQVVAGLEVPDGHDPSLWQALAEMGLPGLFAPEEHGGLGLSLLDAALVAEVAGECALPGPLQSHHVAVRAIMLAGGPAQKARWLPALASGAAIATIAWAEAGDRWEPVAWTLEVDHARLSGAKRHAPCAAAADLMVVGLRGGDLALVETAAAGVERAPFDGVDRTRRLDDIRFDGAAVELLDHGRDVADKVHDFALALYAADAFGCARRLIDETIRHVSQREQFGRPLAQFQGIKHELANMAAELEPTRALWWYAAHACDRDLADAAKTAALANAHIGDTAMAISRACVDLHGALGYAWETPLHLWHKRLMFDRAFLGGSTRKFARAADRSDWGRPS